MGVSQRPVCERSEREGEGSEAKGESEHWRLARSGLWVRVELTRMMRLLFSPSRMQKALGQLILPPTSSRASIV
jgi:hypothetical protein